MTDEPSAAILLDHPEDWFAQAQRAFEAFRVKVERAEREMAHREQEFEMRSRDLAARSEQLQEAWRGAQETSQALMARTHALREEERAMAAGQESLSRERNEVAAARQELEVRSAELSRREAVLSDCDRALREREAAVVQARRELESLRAEREAALTAAGEELARARDALAAREREVRERLAGEAPPAGAERSEAFPERAPQRLLELHEALETATAVFRLRERQAGRTFALAADRAAQVEAIEGKVREREARLESLHAEIVNAKRALLAVDRALARMPYEVVDDFTRTEAFGAYERAVQILKRFEETPSGGTGGP